MMVFSKKFRAIRNAMKLLCVLLLPGSAVSSLIAAPTTGKTKAKIEVIVSIEPASAGTVSGAGFFMPGAVVELKAEAADGYIFSGWRGQVTNPGSATSRTYVIDAPVHITARFDRKRILLDAKVSPEGAGIIEGGGMLPYGILPHVRAIAADGYSFVGWEGAVARSKDLDTPLAKPLSESMKIIARFERASVLHMLTIEADNTYAGKVTGAGHYSHGTEVKVKAEPAVGYEFNGWSGPVLNPGNTETTVVMTADTKVQASFVVKRVFVRTIISPAEGGQVTGDLGVRPFGVPCKLQAEAAPGFEFVGWESAVSNSPKPTITVTPKDDTCVITARFRAK